MKWQAEVEEIQRDNRSGAREIALRAAKALEAFVREEKLRKPQDWQQGLKEVGLALIAAQPSMAPLLTLVNGVFLEAEAKGTSQAKRALLRFLQKYRQTLTQQTSLFASHFLPLLPEDVTLLTHSWSSTVFAVLLEARARGKRFRVVCPEGRPGFEGLRMAGELGKGGIEVQVMVDALAPWWVQKCQCVVVGADSIAPKGFLNKAGTFALALAARAFRVPFYVMAGTEKLLPAPLQSYLHLAERPPSEVLPKRLPRVRAINFYFDLTPLKYLTGVLTEQGFLSPAQVRDLLRRLPVSRLLAASGR